MLAIIAARRAPAVFRSAAPLSTWSAVPAGPPDPILGEHDYVLQDVLTHISTRYY
jgi:hypothetical protein